MWEPAELSRAQQTWPSVAKGLWKDVAAGYVSAFSLTIWNGAAG